jgi:hypothetical protein
MRDAQLFAGESQGSWLSNTDSFVSTKRSPGLFPDDGAADSIAAAAADDVDAADEAEAVVVVDQGPFHAANAIDDGDGHNTMADPAVDEHGHMPDVNQVVHARPAHSANMSDVFQFVEQQILIDDTHQYVCILC